MKIKQKFLPGLVSVTFRKLAPTDIVNLAVKSSLSGIEWGGDIHVPHGDVKRAREVREITHDAGLVTASYGSYYHAGESEAYGLSFSSVLDAAIALEAPLIRIWAGRIGSDKADEVYRNKVMEDTFRVTQEAASVGVALAFEFHANTLTDTAESAAALFAATAVSGMRCYWQPLVGRQPSDSIDALKKILPQLANLHVFQWSSSGERRPLSEGVEVWQTYLELASSSSCNFQQWAMLEFVQNDDPDKFAADAHTLVSLL